MPLATPPVLGTWLGAALRGAGGLNGNPSERASVFQPLERRETFNLIGSKKVEGTAVYRSNGGRVGTIERIMVEKQSGRVAYAIMSFADFMEIGEDYDPLPWSVLKFNPRLEGYEVDVDKQLLKGAPKFGKHESWDWSDPVRGRKIYDHYGVSPYWA